MKMYSERHPVAFSGGLHADPLYAMAYHLAPHGFMLNGEPLNSDRFNDYIGEYGDPKMEIELGAHNGDPQAERDLVHIGRYMLQRGRNPWPGASGALPYSSLNTAANGVRNKMGWPLEYPAPEEEEEDKWDHVSPAYEDESLEEREASFSRDTNSVRSEMSVESKWTVVALGEMQQPGGVGATQDNWNPAVDGPNPDGPNFVDNSQNSPEQEVALQTWVNHAVDLLNQGHLEDEILAQLAQDGCPDPQSILQRALEQNIEQPVSNEAGQDAFQMPVNQEPPLSGGNESVNQQPPVMTSSVVSEGDHVRTSSGETGRVVDSYTDLWGQGTVRVALDQGGTDDYDPNQLVSLDVPSSADPLGDIQSFLDGIEEPGATRAGVEARIDNLTQASLALHEARLSRRLSATARLRADKLKMDVDEEISNLKSARTKLQESDFEYLDSLPGFSINAFAVADAEIVEDASFTRRIAEDATILVDELPEEMLADPLGVELRAYHHAAASYASIEATDTFLAEVERQRIARAESYLQQQRTASVDSHDPFEPYDGPAEQLFL